MIRFLVTEQQLQIVAPIVVADTHGYQTAEGVFKGEAWEGLTKWAHFIKDDATYDVPFLNDEITADRNLDLTAGTWRVYITGHGYDAEQEVVVVRITTTTAYLKVESAESDNPFPPVTPSFSEALAAQVAVAEELAQGVRDDAAAGSFNGATFTPSVDSSGVLRWTNDKGLANPASANIKGPAGKDGNDFTILGYYATLEELQAAVTAPGTGVAYGVGMEDPYDIYVWDAVGLQWINNGPVQGAKGDPGESSTITIGTVSALEPGSAPTVTNSGTASAAVLDFGIPAGKTPIKGVDYMTDGDLQEIAALVDISAAGGILDPAEKSEGQVLTWNGTAWVADDATGGVSSVNGKTGDVTTRIMATNQTVLTSAWVLQSTPTYNDYPYVASKAISGVTPDMTPFVVFSLGDVDSGIFAPVAQSYTDGLYLYASELPSSAITIPLILLFA